MLKGIDKCHIYTCRKGVIKLWDCENTDKFDPHITTSMYSRDQTDTILI
jgi:hypothetical protein